MDMIDCNPLEFWRGTLARGHLHERYRNFSQLAVAVLSARRTVRCFAATVCVGEQDAAWMARIGGRRTVHVVPNGVVLPPEDGLIGQAEHPTLSFTGTLDYPPNVDAVHYTVAEIWPRVRQAIPDARLVIAGRNPTPNITALRNRSGIEIAADVPEMVSVLCRSWVSIAAMRTGVGIKNKVLEAWACARPTVMTPVATNGLTLPPGHEALVCSTPTALADAVVALFNDGARRQNLGLAAREHVRRHATWAAAVHQVDRLLQNAVASAKVDLPQARDIGRQTGG
jgi:glycosyltransferase involved in cell wall biosynthesis